VQHALIQEVEECTIDCSAAVGERRGRYVHLDAFLMVDRQHRGRVGRACLLSEKDEG
jgi:hypothetical protein